MSLWLNAGVPATEVAERAGHSVDVLLKVYAKCIDGQEATVNRRIEDERDRTITLAHEFGHAHPCGVQQLEFREQHVPHRPGDVQPGSSRSGERARGQGSMGGLEHQLPDHGDRAHRAYPESIDHALDVVTKGPAARDATASPKSLGDPWSRDCGWAPQMPLGMCLEPGSHGPSVELHSAIVPETQTVVDHRPSVVMHSVERSREPWHGGPRRHPSSRNVTNISTR